MIKLSAIIVIGILVILLILNFVGTSHGNEVGVKVTWDPHECTDTCISLGGPRATGASLLTGAQASTFLIFTDKEFLETSCSFPLNDKMRRGKLTKGQLYYTDRDYVLTDVPAEFSGFNSIILPNNELKLTTATDYVKFSVPSDATVYVAFDSRYKTLPNWMSKFTNLNKRLLTSHSGQPQMNIYSNKFGDCFPKWQSIKIFVRPEKGTYDYTKPIATIPQNYVAGKSTPTQADLKVEYENFVVSKNYFVLRSYAMVGNEEINSVDSDEVAFEYNMTRPTLAVLSVNKTPTDYVFSWGSTGGRTVKYELHYSFKDPGVSRGGYKALRTIDAPNVSTSIPIAEVEELMGENPAMWLTLVSVTKESIYSRWTEKDVMIEKSSTTKLLKRVEGIRIID